MLRYLNFGLPLSLSDDELELFSAARRRLAAAPVSFDPLSRSRSDEDDRLEPELEPEEELPDFRDEEEEDDEEDLRSSSLSRSSSRSWSRSRS